ncbi:unnamed protein product [Arabidopsis halleri]
MEYPSSEEEDLYDYSSHEEETGQDVEPHEDVYGDSWPQDGYSISDCGDELEEDEPEPKPPDYDQDDASHRRWYDEFDSQIEDENFQINPEDEQWREEEKSSYEGYEEDSCGDEAQSQFSLDKEPWRETEPNNHEKESWHEEVEFQFTQEEEREEEFNQEETTFMGLNHDNKSWCDETDSQFSLRGVEQCGEKEDHESGSDVMGLQTPDQISYGYPRKETPYSHGVGPGLIHTKSSFTKPWNHGNKRERFDSQLLTFSGNKQGPEAYLLWEKNMEQWLRFQNIPKEKKLHYALKRLVGEAHSWWLEEEAQAYYLKPITTWGNLKQRMYREFVQKSYNKSYIPKRLMFETTTNSWMSKAIPKTPPKEASSPKPEITSTTILKEEIESKTAAQAKEERPKSNLHNVATKPRAIPLLEPHGELRQCKSSKLSKSKEVICYRCHERGHFAANCPTRQVERSTILMSKSDAHLVTPSVENSNSCMIHLLLSKNVDSGHIMEHKDNEVERSKSVEKQPSKTLVGGTYDLIRYWNYSTIHRCIKYSVLIDSNSSIIHLILFLSVKRKTGCVDLRHKGRETATKKSLTSDPTEELTRHVNIPPYPEPMLCLPATKEREDVTNNFLPQEEPPDQTSSSFALLNTGHKFTIELDQVSSSLVQFVSNSLSDVIMNLISTEECEQTVGSLNDLMERISCRKEDRVVDTLCDILCDTVYGREIVQTKLVLPAYIVAMTAITHLFLAQSVDELAGTIKEHTNHKDDSPEKKKLVDQSQNLSGPAPLMITPPVMETRRVPNSCLIKEEPPDFKAQVQTREGATQGTPQTITPDPKRGVILSFCPKEEPSDAPCITKSPPHQGKTLASRKRIKANLLSLGVDSIVSRTKLFQGRGYDADIQTTQYQDDGRIKPAAEPKLIQTGCTTPIRPDKDICSVFEAYQLNHDDSRHETTWRLFTAQLQNTKKNNHPKSYYHQEVMEVTSQQTSNRRDGDMRPFIESPRANQEEPSFKTTCFGNLTHQMSFSNWNQVDTNFGLRDIKFLNRRTLDLPYLEFSNFGSLQTYVWQPGELLHHLEGLKRIFMCRKDHWIRWIQSYPTIHQDLLNIDPRAFNAHPQRLCSDLRHRMSVSIRLLNHGYTQKLS